MVGRIEPGLLVLLVAGLLLGVGASFLAPEFYELTLSAEDGPLEWATALALFAAAVLCFWRAFVLRASGGRFVAMTVLGGIILFFGAGEEISWGQRVFGWSSGEFWQEHNDQAETNLHNLMVGDVKVNRVLFGVVLTLVFFLYFIVLPVVASRFEPVRRAFARWFIPVPRLRHAALFFISLIAMSVIQTGRAPELGEFGLGLLLAAVVINPMNKAEIY